MSTVTPKFKIYGLYVSPRVQRSAFAAYEVGLDFDLVTVNVLEGEQKTPEHLKRHPLGLIPSLEVIGATKDTSFQIFESRAIGRYFNEIGGDKLTPKDPKTRALAEQWISFEQSTLSPALGTIADNRIFAGPFKRAADEAAVRRAAEDADVALKVLDDYLRETKSTFLAGSQFSLADAFTLPWVRLALATPEGKTLFAKRPHVVEWHNRVSERPAWKKLLSKVEF